MATHKSPLGRGEKERGVSTEEKATVVPLDQRVPTNPAYMHMKKEQFVAEMERLKLKKTDMKRWSKEYDEKKAREQAAKEAGSAAKPAAEAGDAPEKPKKKGRSKKA